MIGSGFTIKAVLFDFDGTLTAPGALDFKAIRLELGCPAHLPVLEYIDTIHGHSARQALLDRLGRFEMLGAQSSRPNSGALEVVVWVKAQQLPMAIITRNSRASVMRALENFSDWSLDDFDFIITRDDPMAVKPSGDGIVWAARQWGIRPAEIITVGDYIFDPQAGRAAGALTVLLDPEQDPRLAETACDFRIARLTDLLPIIAAGRPLPAGKLPNSLLASFLEMRPVADPSVFIGPAVGQDVAAVDVDPEQVLILKTDPITFASEAIGHYAVKVAANDIATAGASPRWLLTTLLLPVGTTPSRVQALMRELFEAAVQAQITLCGGHTEISEAVQRPVVVAMMAGTVKRNALVEKKNMSQGDVVVLTKQVAIEGTAIMAREFEASLKVKGLNDLQIEAGRNYLAQISIVPEAQVAAQRNLATAMHDVTEGGVATALEELSTAGGHRIRVDMETIPISDLTREMCTALGLDPLGLIGSGSLLICCRPEKCSELIDAIQARDIAATPIGQVLTPGTGIAAYKHGRFAEWPRFASDEITKLYSRGEGASA